MIGNVINDATYGANKYAYIARYNKKKRAYDDAMIGVGYKGAPLKWKRYVILAIVIAFFVYALAVAGISAYAGREAIRPAIKELPPISVNLAVDYSSVNFKSIDGTTTLRGWLFKAPNSENIVIMIHGWGENRFNYGAETLDLVETFIDNDFSVLAFDLRNSGDSDQSISTYGLFEKDDVLGAINYALNAHFSNIVLFGFSTGANAAILAAAKPIADRSENPVVTQQFLDVLSSSVDALILDTPVTDVGDYIMRVLDEKGFDLPYFPFKYTIPFAVNLNINGDINKVDDDRALNNFVPRPVLLIHGENDSIVKSDDIQEMYDQYMEIATGKISIWSDPNSGHMENYYNSRRRYLEKITIFLEMVFPGDS
ncbi:MAG: alpha/beta hydrolase [Oscillospiraceae bacterium]|nr:alpha/beta hydrolase [Oscillospiraceae bacterium]